MKDEEDELEELDPVVRELRLLRKGAGMTFAKLKDSPALLQELCVTTPSEAYELLLKHLNTMPPGRKLDALLCAYAIDDDSSRLLTERRRDFGADLRPDDPYHSDTVEGWENNAIDELRARITGGLTLEATRGTLDTVVVHGQLKAERNGTGITRVWLNPAAPDGKEAKTDVRAATFGEITELLWTSHEKVEVLLFQMEFFEAQPWSVWLETYADIDSYNARLPTGSKLFAVEFKEHAYGTTVQHPVPGAVYRMRWLF